MTRKLEELFDLPSGTKDDDTLTVSETQTALAEIDSTIDKIDAALPAVKGLDASDGEMDELAGKATQTFEELMDLGMNVDSRYAAEIFAVASTMLGHALTAKTAKLNKKLKMIDLQMKKAKLDREVQGNDSTDIQARGHVLSRNELLERLTNRDQKSEKA